VFQVSGAAGDAAKKDLERKIKKIGMTLVQVFDLHHVRDCDGCNVILCARACTSTTSAVTW
jgi:hypothetical protein